MSKWIAEFELEDGDTMPEHMDLEYKGAKLDFHCRPKEPILDKIRAEIERKIVKRPWLDFEDRERDRNDAFLEVLDIIDSCRTESEGKEWYYVSNVEK